MSKLQENSPTSEIVKEKIDYRSFGRPEKVVDWDEFEKLCGLMCTQVEIAHWFNMCDDTLNKKVKAHYGTSYSDVYKRFSDTGKISLRRWQINAAQSGSVAMLIWLGKVYLGQKETVVQIQTNPTEQAQLNPEQKEISDKITEILKKVS